jgi:phosphoribosylanthranilate isomerase
MRASPRVKMCDIRSAADLRIAVAAGVDAVATGRPFAVDVNSGIENEHGDKDAGRSFQFVDRTRNG